MRPYFIGITGGSASGKTSFLNALLNHFEPADICLVSQDNYYKPKDQQVIDEGGIENFDIPESIDREWFHRDIQRLRNGEEVEKMEYTFNNSSVQAKKLFFKPAKIVVVEGLFVLYFKEIRDLLDLKLFIDTQSHVALKRRIIRDSEERGYDLADVLYRFENHVMPAFDLYLRPTKYDADFIIPNDNGFENALKVIQGHVGRVIQDGEN